MREYLPLVPPTGQMPSFTEQWYGADQQTKLATLAQSLLGRPGVCIEVGCWEGRSTACYANAIYPELLYAIDHFGGVVGSGKDLTDAALAERDIKAIFTENMRRLTAGNICLIRSSWQEAMAGWTQPVKMAHIDGSHTYDEVRGNILALLPHLTDGAILCFDDYHFGPVYEAINDTLTGAYYDALGIWINH